MTDCSGIDWKDRNKLEGQNLKAILETELLKLVNTMLIESSKLGIKHRLWVRFIISQKEHWFPISSRMIFGGFYG